MKKMYKLVAFMLVVGWASSQVFAQTLPAYALKNVMIHHADGSTTSSATIVWRNGIISEVGTNISIPYDAYEIDGGDSLHVYPGFIDGLAIWGSPDRPRNLERLPEPGNPPFDRAGVEPERNPYQLVQDDKVFEEAMKAGFTTAALGLQGYMLPGEVDVFTLHPSDIKKGLFKAGIATRAQFENAPGGRGNGAYPSTLMGVMAKFRQVMYDATALQDHIKYHASNSAMPAPERSDVLESLFPLLNKSQKLYFHVDSKEDIERVFTLQDEFGFEVVIVSGKEAYAKADELKKRNIAVLVSADVMEAPKWYADEKKTSEKKDEDKEKEADKKEITAEEKEHRQKQLDAWMKHVKNIKSLMDSGVQIGYASTGLAPKDLSKKMEILLTEGGLTEKDLVTLMTVNTANILGINASFGEMKSGKNASFTVFSKPISDKKAKATHSISNGAIYEF